MILINVQRAKQRSKTFGEDFAIVTSTRSIPVESCTLMATNLPLRTLRRATGSAIRKRPRPKHTTLVQNSTFTTSLSSRIDEDVDPADRPRWQQTPRAMVAPVSTNFKREQHKFRVNEDPRKLDEVYNRILGNGGDQMLPEEVKWLAITHKSFDHGRRGFNDRLAYFGKSDPTLAKETLLWFEAN